ncbi:xanthine dehydrogenase YagR molybdenum-binding subunit [Janthinobacterium sp. CG_23.3]|uniref:xanthine dehydrogenase family protein molybdopterin-binding subunit n=1 Tax=Janthinobacterium sp. CG_23.3 TaxID=3349634 RepID=UPI0038D4A41B
MNHAVNNTANHAGGAGDSAAASQLGRPLSRTDGRGKVTGAARYVAEIAVPGVAYGYIVSSSIARGRVSAIATEQALAVPGVAHVLTHLNRPTPAWFDRNYRDDDAPPGSPFRPLYDDIVRYSGQPVALVLADSFEAARQGAALVRVDYQRWRHGTNLDHQRGSAYAPGKTKAGFALPAPRGDFDAAFGAAAVQVEAEYRHAAQHHNPMEMHASTVIVEADGGLTIYDKTQGPLNSQNYVCKVFGLAPERVRVKSAFVGGAFGSGLRPQHQLFLAVMAALALQRPVKLALTRQQMFSFGHRPETVQRLALGAAADGTLLALRHEAIAETSRCEDYTENVVDVAGQMYRCANVAYAHRLVALDVHTPLDMRAPGGVSGCFALECAIDELAHALDMDPLELRLKNYTERDQNRDQPFSSKELRACFAQGAAHFGWNRRPRAPRTLQAGQQLVGWGMAAGIWGAHQLPAQARAVLGADGKLSVSSASADIGTGTVTVMTQIAAATLGLAAADVTFALGDSALPKAPLQGGSFTVASVGTAVQAACLKLARKLLRLARQVPRSPLSGALLEDVEFAGGAIYLKADAGRAVTLVEAMRHAGLASLEDSAKTLPSPKHLRYNRSTHSAVFVEVTVDRDLGTVRVTRVVSAVAGGRILNPKTARSQILGGVVWGIGMALMEHSATDHVLGRYMNHSLAEYHIPVHADIHDIEVIFVEEKDDIVNPLGAKGLGEIGIVGVAAAVANAIFHATGTRVRALPITPDKLL